MTDEMRSLLQRVRREMVTIRDASNSALFSIDNALSEPEDVPEPLSTRRHRDWEIMLAPAFDIEPGKYATRSVKILIAQFNAKELLLSACDIDGINIAGTFNDVRVHQLIVDDIVPVRFTRRRMSTEGTSQTRIVTVDSKNAPCFRNISLTLQNKGKVKRRVDAVIRGYGRIS